MKRSFLKRLHIVEKVVNASKIDEADKIIIVAYNADDEEEFDRSVKGCMVELRKKYGPNVAEDDFQIIGIRKFYREAKHENRS